MYSSSQRPHPRDINMQTCLYCLDACLLNANPEKHVCAHHLRAVNIGADSDESCNLDGSGGGMALWERKEGARL